MRKQIPEQRAKSKETGRPLLPTNYCLVTTLVLLWLILPQGISQAAPYTLTVTANNGSVRVNPDKPFYEEGEEVELIPKPETGYSFRNWSGDVQSKRLVLNITMDSDKAITANFGPWQPPIGIPMPEFGIFETYRMYDDPANRNPNLTYHQNEEGGYYTHYIDNTHPNATDTDNPFGTAERPRMTIPIEVVFPPGSVIEIHGGPYTWPYEREHIWKFSGGTSEQPVFMRGVNQEDKPVIASHMRVAGSYLILENLDFDGAQLCFHSQKDQDFMAIRYSEVHHNTKKHGIWISSSARNIVVYNNNIHHNGDWQSEVEVGYHGVELWGGTEKIWIVDNHIHHNGEDGFQSMSGRAKHIYIGRNVMNHNRENAVDVKIGQHVIISQNTFYGYRPTSGASGDAVRINDEGELDNIWILFNDIYDSTIGIETWGATFPPYIIGNKIHDLVGGFKGGTYRNSKGIGTRGAGPIVNNLIYNVDIGIDEERTIIVNNIISQASMFHLDCDVEVRNNLLWQNGEPVTTRGAAPLIDCIEADPLFVDAANGDFHLRPTSPAIDSGTVSDVYQTFYDLYGIDISVDFEGNPRPLGSAWDIGAYEYTPSTFRYGDVSGDGTISATDASMAARYSVGLIELTPEQRQAADVSGDGTISSLDASLIARYSVGLIEVFPVEE